MLTSEECGNCVKTELNTLYHAPQNFELNQQLRIDCIYAFLSANFHFAQLIS